MVIASLCYMIMQASPCEKVRVVQPVNGYLSCMQREMIASQVETTLSFLQVLLMIVR